jgi:hypothetical protein
MMVKTGYFSGIIFTYGKTDFTESRRFDERGPWETRAIRREVNDYVAENSRGLKEAVTAEKIPWM